MDTFHVNFLSKNQDTAPEAVPGTNAWNSKSSIPWRMRQETLGPGFPQDFPRDRTGSSLPFLFDWEDWDMLTFLFFFYIYIYSWDILTCLFFGGFAVTQNWGFISRNVGFIIHIHGDFRNLKRP